MKRIFVYGIACAVIMSLAPAAHAGGDVLDDVLENPFSGCGPAIVSELAGDAYPVEILCTFNQSVSEGNLKLLKVTSGAETEFATESIEYPNTGYAGSTSKLITSFKVPKADLVDVDKLTFKFSYALTPTDTFFSDPFDLCVSDGKLSTECPEGVTTLPTGGDEGGDGDVNTADGGEGGENTADANETWLAQDDKSIFGCSLMENTVAGGLGIWWIITLGMLMPVAVVRIRGKKY